MSETMNDKYSIAVNFLEDIAKELQTATFFFGVRYPLQDEWISKISFKDFQKYLIGFEEFVFTSLSYSQRKPEQERYLEYKIINNTIININDLIEIFISKYNSKEEINHSKNEFRMTDEEVKKIYKFGVQCVKKAKEYFSNIVMELSILNE